MKTNGGYVILDLADTQNVYAQAQNCLLVNKPVMVYDNNQVYYVDTIILDGTNIVLTKGGKIITIANDNTITTSGRIQDIFHRYNISIKDTNNNEYVIYAFLKNLPYKTKQSLDVDSDIFNYLIGNVLDRDNILVDFASSTVLVINDYNDEDLELELVKYDGTSFATITVSKIYFSIAD